MVMAAHQHPGEEPLLILPEMSQADQSAPLPPLQPPNPPL